MRVLVPALVLLLITSCTTLAGGKFEGNLILLPPGCQKTAKHICHLGAPLRYTSPGGGLVWQADKWRDGNGQSGTTDGASIPPWAQPIIGGPYDKSYLKAAILHDHYCYDENHVRTWRLTDRMFYDAMRDLGVSDFKAKIMYYAVVVGGPHWVKLVPGQYCGKNCINEASATGFRVEGDVFGTVRFQSELDFIKTYVTNNRSVSHEALEKLAKERNPGEFFLSHGSTYSPTGPNDPNIFPRM